MRRRRKLLLAFAASAMTSPLPVLAQRQPTTVPRIGVLTATALTEHFQDGLRCSLRDLGYIEGQNIVIEWRGADGRPDLAKSRAIELARLKVDVIVANQAAAVRAAKEATSTIPIVMASAVDPVAAGFIASLSRPGGNITGVTGSSIELPGKRIELLQTIVPGLSRVGLLFNGAGPLAKAFLRETQDAAKKLGVQLQALDVRRAEDMEAAFQALTKGGAGAVVVQATAAAPSWRAAELAVRHRLPSISFSRDYPATGGLMSYGTHRAEVHQRAAMYVQKILNGAKPADLPVELPTRFEFVINRKTAKSLGIAIPPSLLVQADEVIE